MRTKTWRTWPAVGALCLGLCVSGAFAHAAVPTAEDLTGCILPNGRAVLPTPGSQLASNGSIFKFSTGAFSAVPAKADDGSPLTADQAVAKINSDNLGDLQYVIDGKGNASLWTFSGYISSVPDALYLADNSGKQLQQPGLLPKTSKTFAGQMPDIDEGAVYLVKTTDGRFVLLRVLEMTKDALVVQYVYQPNGTANFTIPTRAHVPYARPTDAQTAPAPATTTAAAPPLPVLPAGSAIASVAPIPTGAVDPIFSSAGGSMAPDNPPPPAVARTTLPPVQPIVLGPDDINDPKNRIIRIVGPSAPPAPAPRPAAAIITAPAPVTGAPAVDPAVDALVQQRIQMIQHRLDIMAAPAKTAQDIERKSQAILELGYLHADDPAVADALVSEITFVNTRTPVKEFSPDALYPCLGALKHLGEPAVAAALRGLHQLDLDTPGADADSPIYKVKLLANVIRSVEGDDVADFIFRREAAKETDARHKAVFEYLLTN
jgi:hypothetical protein